MLKLRKGDAAKAAVLVVLILAVAGFIYYSLSQLGPSRTVKSQSGRTARTTEQSRLSTEPSFVASRPRPNVGLAQAAIAPDPFRPLVDPHAAPPRPAAKAVTAVKVLKPSSSPPLPGPASTPSPITLTDLRLVGVIANPNPLALLQEGSDRRLVRAGESLANGWRVASITFREVTLVKGKSRATLRLGGEEKRPSRPLSPLRPS